MIGLTYSFIILSVKLSKWLQIGYVSLEQLIDVVNVHCILEVM